MLACSDDDQLGLPRPGDVEQRMHDGATAPGKVDDFGLDMYVAASEGVPGLAEHRDRIPE